MGLGTSMHTSMGWARLGRNSLVSGSHLIFNDISLAWQWI